MLCDFCDVNVWVRRTPCLHSSCVSDGIHPIEYGYCLVFLGAIIIAPNGQINGIAHDCYKFIAHALELLQTYAKPSTYGLLSHMLNFYWGNRMVTVHRVTPRDMIRIYWNQTKPKHYKVLTVNTLLEGDSLIMIKIKSSPWENFTCFWLSAD